MAQPGNALPSLEDGDHLDREEFHRRYELRPDLDRAELVDGVVHLPTPRPATMRPGNLLPSLENGDHLDREEFHRRYEARADIQRAELVEGVVHVPSPMRYEPHDDPAALCVGLLRRYRALHPDVRAGANATLILDGTNEVQPDGFLFREGTLRRTEAQYLEGAPELVVEVSASTASYDLHEKKEAYRRNGVREYLVWRVLDGAIDFFRLERGELVRVQATAEGVYESLEFPGLRFDTKAMLAIDDAAAQAALR